MLERVAFLRLLEPIEASGGRTLASLSEETDRIDALLAEQRSGAFSIDDAVDRFVQAHLLDRDPAWVERYKRYVLESVAAFVVPLPGWDRLHKAIHEARIPYALLTNGWNPLQLRKAECIGFGGPVVASADIGAQKPDARAFEELTQVLGVPAEDIWYVGDNPIADVEGALSAGMRGIWLDAESGRYPDTLLPPSETIHSLSELASRLTR